MTLSWSVALLVLQTALSWQTLEQQETQGHHRHHLHYHHQCHHHNSHRHHHHHRCRCHCQCHCHHHPHIFIDCHYVTSHNCPLHIPDDNHLFSIRLEMSHHPLSPIVTIITYSESGYWLAGPWGECITPSPSSPPCGYGSQIR